MDISIRDLPHLNAILNATSSLLILLGFYFIKRKNRAAHRKAMIAALASSVLFLISYLTYHFQVGSVKFTAEGVPRTIYFIILSAHTLCAMSLLFFVPTTLVHALRERFDRHKRIARWTLPIWLFVNITGIIVYLMLYQRFPPNSLK
jgi:putative membrane protein